MNQSMIGLKRTDMCGTIDAAFVSKSITVMGWVQRRRDLGQLIFITLRDKTGIVQIVVDGNGNDKKLFEIAESVRSEFVLAIVGTVNKRNDKDINKNMKTGAIEIAATEIRILAESETTPFLIEDGNNVKDDLRIKYRYLDLRKPEILKNIVLRHNVCKYVREFLNNEDFLEIETPMLTKSTPEGARDYLVPSRVHPGDFYALPQSPQLLKQLLMVSGMDKYYQIVKCFRDEDLRADRQPEFTQIDMELSFVDMEDVLEMNERLIKDVFKKAMNVEVSIPFKRIPHAKAMEDYGSDKPDTRFDIKLKNISDVVAGCEFVVFKDALDNGGSVRGINAPGLGSMPRKQIDALVTFVKTYKAKGLAWISVLEDGTFKSQISKFFSDEKMKEIVEALEGKPGDLLLICADKDSIVFDSLGNLRLEIAKKLELLDSTNYDFLWVTEFPLLEFDEEAGRFVAIHHPFTAPMDEDISLIDENPAKVRAKAYDMVLNGTELGGGSVRIYQKELQQKMFSLLGFSDESAYENFGFLLDAFKYGVPPHAGLAFGLDRMIMLMSGATSIRDVIAFPKIKDASCPMTDAPNVVSKAQLEELYIDLIEKVETNENLDA